MPSVFGPTVVEVLVRCECGAPPVRLRLRDNERFGTCSGCGVHYQLWDQHDGTWSLEWVVQTPDPALSMVGS